MYWWNRKGDISAELTAELADYQALDADIIQCIQRADEVHTMTSLSGQRYYMASSSSVTACPSMPVGV